jgi:hypothetical protein
MKLIEINGIKLEIDERTAKTVEQYKVGDKIKVLVKGYSDSYTVYPGVIIGFAEFKSLPTIELMYCDRDRWEADCFKFAYLNAASKDIEIAPFNELESLLDKQAVIEKMDSAIARKKQELQDFEVKREYFIKRFAKAFERLETQDIA